MTIQSQRAKEIEAFIRSNDEVGKWNIEISGQKRNLPFYRFPLDLLQYNVNNGRIALDRQEWEKQNGRELDPSIPEDAAVIRGILLDLEPHKTESLRKDLHQKGQMEPGVITHDGVVINGNRRMAILEQLDKTEPTGKWPYLEAILLPPSVSEKDLWRIEAGLQLSKDKTLEYHPVNNLLKIKQGVEAGLSPEEVAAVMYGRTVQEVKESLKRLELIENFLEFCGAPRDYGLIRKYRLHEYFINIQNAVLQSAERRGVKKSESNQLLPYTFALIRAHMLIGGASGTRKRGLTHFAIRDLANIFVNDRAKSVYLEHLRDSQKLTEVSPKTIINDFENAKEVLDNQKQQDQPVRLIQRAMKALESINQENEHFKSSQVQQEMARLTAFVQMLNCKLDEG